MTTRYVSNTGSGSTYSIGSPGHPVGALTASSGDDRILALDGVYTGTNYMIQPPAGKSGTSGHPITFSAVNDGAVRIDSEYSNGPAINLNNNDWLIIEGIDACNADSGNNVVDLSIDSSNNIIRRCCGWNAGDTHAVFNDTGQNNLIEDCAGFGQGRKICGNSQGSNGSTYRRFFGCWNYSTATNGPKETASNGYNSHTGRYENCIFTMDADPSTPHFDDDDVYGLMIFERMNDIYPDMICDGIYDGCIGYIKSTQSAPINIALMQGGSSIDGIEYKNCAVYTELAIDTCSNQDLAGIYDGPSAGLQKSTSVTEIRTSGTSRSIGANWVVTNSNVASTVLAAYGAQSLWNNNGTVGAEILNRLEAGVDTGIPIFPWPMRDRILAAMALSTYSPEAIDVDADMAAIFGTIPSITPAGTPPVDDMDSYSVGSNISTGNGGTGAWLGAYVAGSGTITFETAPAGGQGGVAIRSIGAGGSYGYRTFDNVSTGTFRWEMSSSVTNPNDDRIGVSMHETGVSIRAQVQFSSGGNIRAYDYDGAAWVDVLVGFSASTLYRIELEIDGTLQPDLYRVRVNEGTWTAWIGASGTMTVLNHFQINNFSTNSTLYLDAIGATFTPPSGIPVDDFDSYSAGVDLNGLNGGMRWGGAWTKVTGTINVATAPAGMLGNAIKSS